jgi:protein-tyrosine phosphatase
MVENISKVSVLFVCMGNICRSPTAEGVFRHAVTAEGLAEQILTDSAGTHAYHIGQPPDERSQAAARRRGVSLSDMRARRIRGDDFDRFNYVVAMDRLNLHMLLEMKEEGQPADVGLFLQYANGSDEEVPDPYYGGTAGFERVLDLVEAASRGLLETLRTRHSI